jgi:hypothetical protein
MIGDIQNSTVHGLPLWEALWEGYEATMAHQGDTQQDQADPDQQAR